jgi:DNA repair exonuclease SbcCD ATPase subunit
MNSPFRFENSNSYTEPNYGKIDNFFEMKNRILNLEQNNNFFKSENERLSNLNHSLQKERIELKSLNDSKENTIREQIAILDNLKNKNEKLENRILDLEKINSDLNYSTIELNQKNKTLIENQNILLASINQKDLTDKLINLSNQLDNLAIIKSRLEYDNKILANKLNSLQLENENEVNMLKTIHNSEIAKKNKIISNLQNGLTQLKLPSNEINNMSFQNTIHPQSIMEEFSNFERKTKMIKDDNLKLYNLVNNLESKVKTYEESIQRKDNYIKELQNNLENIENQFKLNKEENESINKENQYQIEKFSQEREELIKQNSNYKNAYENFNIGMQDVNDLFSQKAKSFQTLILNYNQKLRELQMKIDQLTEQNEVLSLENQKIKRINQRYERRDFNLNKKNPLTRTRNLSFNSSGKNLLNTSYNNNSNRNFNETNNTVSGMAPDYNINQTYNSYVNVIPNRRTYNIENTSIGTEDHSVISQQKSLENFRNVLQKVDENLSENSLVLNRFKDSD